MKCRLIKLAPCIEVGHAEFPAHMLPYLGKIIDLTPHKQGVDGHHCDYDWEFHTGGDRWYLCNEWVIPLGYENLEEHKEETCGAK